MNKEEYEKVKRKALGMIEKVEEIQEIEKKMDDTNNYINTYLVFGAYIDEMELINELKRVAYNFYRKKAEKLNEELGAML